MNYELKTQNCKSKGFTLIELLVVITVIGILVAFVIANFGGAQGRSRDAKRKSDLDAIKKALQLYYSDYNSFPAYNCWSDGVCWANLVDSTYIKSMPTDPKNTGSYLYKYCQFNNQQSYVLLAALENSNDPNNQTYTGPVSCLSVPEGPTGKTYIIDSP